MGEIETRQQCAAARDLLQTSDVNWLLHRAAQRFGETMENAVAKQGATMRGYLVLTSLVETPGRSQLALGAALALDKTTLTSVLDKLEQHGLVVRRPVPTDRRVRIPEITAAGRQTQQRIAATVRAVQCDLLGALSGGEQEILRAILQRLITTDGGDDAPSAGSCL